MQIRRIKYYINIIGSLLLMMFFFSNCHSKKNITTSITNQNNTIGTKISTSKANDIIAYAKTLIGSPYLYGGNTAKGFDCSGFVHHVFAHFQIKVPRQSTLFEKISKAVLLTNVIPCDIILFGDVTGNIQSINHVGIIISGTNSDIQFIHASSSKGVMISGLNSYFKPRVTKVVRLS